MPGSLLVVGSVAFDTIESPFGRRDNILGGSATYFASAASLFTQTRIVSVVGKDFPEEFFKFLHSRNVDATGIEVKEGKTFAWHGRYGDDLAEATTVSVSLNLFGKFQPVVPPAYRDSNYVFLANGSPVLQGRVADQMTKPTLVVGDTMNLWIETQRDPLEALLKRVDGMVMNRAELHQFTECSNTIQAGREILALGPKFLIVKKGEHGAILFTKNEIFSVPAYPVEVVKDPTGAGDAFAGGVMGYLAKCDDPTPHNLKIATVFGNILASFVVEDFGVDALRDLTFARLEERFQGFVKSMRL